MYRARLTSPSCWTFILTSIFPTVECACPNPPTSRRSSSYCGADLSAAVAVATPPPPVALAPPALLPEADDAAGFLSSSSAATSVVASVSFDADPPTTASTVSSLGREHDATIR
jgi:hypothetical protein